MWLGEDSGKTVYRSNKDEMAQRLVKIGLYIYAVLKRLRDDAPGYDLLHRVFHDQYVVAQIHADFIQVEMLQATVARIVEQYHNGHNLGNRELSCPMVRALSRYFGSIETIFV